MESLYGVLKVQEKVPEEKALRRRIIPDSSMVEHTAVNRGVVGSSPTRGVWPHGQAVKTSPFHGGNTGSIPVGVILQKALLAVIKFKIWRSSQAVRRGSATP